MHPREEKEALRNAIRDRLARLGEGERKAESRSLTRRILENLPKPPLTVCAFYPLKDEVDLRALLTTLLKEKYTLFLPRFEGELVFRHVDNLNVLSPGKFGIPEPPESAPLLDPKALQIALIPARAFTKDGKRLGRGNGGYDIWIRKQRAANPATQFFGVALELQIVQSVPMEAHDEKVDAIVTARGLQQIV